MQLMGEADFSITYDDGNVLMCRAVDTPARDAWVQVIAKNIITLRDHLQPSKQGRR